MASSLASVAAGLAQVRRQLAEQGPTALSCAESRLEHLSNQLLLADRAEDPLGADTVAAEARALTELLAAGEAWCGNLAKLVSCQTQGYGGVLEPRGGNRVQLIG